MEEPRPRRRPAGRREQEEGRHARDRRWARARERDAVFSLAVAIYSLVGKVIGPSLFFSLLDDVFSGVSYAVVHVNEDWNLEIEESRFCLLCPQPTSVCIV